MLLSSTRAGEEIMSRSIEYGNLMHDAMRGLIRQVLLDVAANGLPGNHHFFITFDTAHPDAELADWLSDRYPGEMTVVMQHWYDKLEVTEEGFSVTLNFGDAQRLGVGKRIKTKMIINMLIDFVGGLVPFFGDIFDAFFKANTRNTRLLKNHIAKQVKSEGIEH